MSETMVDVGVYSVFIPDGVGEVEVTYTTQDGKVVQAVADVKRTEGGRKVAFTEFGGM